VSGATRGRAPGGTGRAGAESEAESAPFAVQALSGRPIEALTLEAAVSGVLTPADLRVHPDTLRRQAAVAEAHGNPQLGENLRRAAEMTALPDDEVLAVYEALRPGRSSAAGLADIAERLRTAGAPLCAALVREAAEVYARRGLLRPG
jgi:propanediol dehydratase small subunit